MTVLWWSENADLLSSSGGGLYGGDSESSPPTVRDAEDAITTVLTNKAATFPDMPAPTSQNIAQYKSVYEVNREGAVWHLIPRPLGARRGEGCHYWIDAKTGCVVKSICIN